MRGGVRGKLDPSRGARFSIPGTTEDVPDFLSCVRPSNKIASPGEKIVAARGTRRGGVGKKKQERGRRSERASAPVAEGGGRTPALSVASRRNESAVTRNKRGGDPKLLVEVQSEGLGMSLRRGGDETLP